MKKIITLAALAIAITASATLKSSWPLTVGMVSWPTTEGEISLSSEPVKQVADSTVTVKSDTIKVRIHPAEK